MIQRNFLGNIFLFCKIKIRKSKNTLDSITRFLMLTFGFEKIQNNTDWMEHCTAEYDCNFP